MEMHALATRLRDMLLDWLRAEHPDLLGA